MAEPDLEKLRQRYIEAGLPLPSFLTGVDPLPPGKSPNSGVMPVPRVEDFVTYRLKRRASSDPHR